MKAEMASSKFSGPLAKFIPKIMGTTGNLMNKEPLPTAMCNCWWLPNPAAAHNCWWFHDPISSYLDMVHLALLHCKISCLICVIDCLVAGQSFTGHLSLSALDSIEFFLIWFPPGYTFSNVLRKCSWANKGSWWIRWVWLVILSIFVRICSHPSSPFFLPLTIAIYFYSQWDHAFRDVVLM